MGTAARVTYEFDRAFWSRFSKLRAASFVLAPDFIPPTWWTTDPWPDSALTGWLGGRTADESNLAELPETGLATLAELLGSGVPELRKHLVRWHRHDWKNDVYSLGSYTYVPRGAIRASDDLSVPVEKTLFFAGEHTDTSGHWGTVHGALRSAYRAAEQVRLSQMR
jgi:monoamine oxidase